MLYDPKWDGPSAQGFRSWLSMRDPNATYNYNDMVGQCLICQYLTAAGIEGPMKQYGRFGSQGFRIGVAGGGEYARRGEECDWTYGKALERLDAFMETHEAAETEWAVA
jgi:hypothetical protein